MQRLWDWWQPPDPKELVRKWQATLRAEQRQLERQVRDIKVEEQKTVQAVKEAAKRGDTASARVLCKEVVHTRKAVSRLYTNKAQLMSINNALVEQLAMLRVSKTIGRSAEVMQLVNQAMKLPELNKSMVEMSREMMKAGMIDEMMGEAIDGALDTDDMEEETEEQVNVVLSELLGETLASMPAVAAQRAKAAQQPAAAQRAGEQEQGGEEEEGEDLSALHARLEAVRSG